MTYLKRFLSAFHTIRQSAAGFTMIELLVVIAVIGVLAVAVLSSINPIEQINKGRDTRTRSDAAQLINAVDRYYAIHEKYPWNVNSDSGFTATVLLPVDEYFFNGGSGGDFDWLDNLTETGEVKDGFTNRLKSQDTSSTGAYAISLFKEGTSNATMYACFLPTSLAFKQEAADNCANGSTLDNPVAGGITTCADGSGQPTTKEDVNYICLP